MGSAKIVVVGSSNMDLVVKTDRIPRGGETVLGGVFSAIPGGKGANQAVCAARLGTAVALVSKLGNDVFGDSLMDNFRDNGVDTTYVGRDNNYPTGVALIAVDEDAENAIVVAPGANSALTPADVDNAARAIADADVMLVQFEIPTETVLYAISLAHSLGTLVIVNPAPMRPIPADIFSKIDIMTPNQHEAAQLLSKVEDGAPIAAASAAAELRQLGVRTVVITLGSEGAYLASDTTAEYVDPIKVDAVDTTAAGDAFTASLACALSAGRQISDAVRFASKVAAISVTRMGAQTSLPMLHEVDGWPAN